MIQAYAPLREGFKANGAGIGLFDDHVVHKTHGDRGRSRAPPVRRWRDAAAPLRCEGSARHIWTKKYCVKGDKWTIKHSKGAKVKVEGQTVLSHTVRKNGHVLYQHYDKYWDTRSTEQISHIQQSHFPQCNVMCVYFQESMMVFLDVSSANVCAMLVKLQKWTQRMANSKILDLRGCTKWFKPFRERPVQLESNEYKRSRTYASFCLFLFDALVLKCSFCSILQQYVIHKLPCSLSFQWLKASTNMSSMSKVIKFWLVVWTPMKNISQMGWLFPIHGKIKNVPNHQPELQLPDIHA